MKDLTAPHRNQWALITGASAGIGRELARCCAADGFNLILVARNQPSLVALANELTAAHGIDVQVLVRDLATSGAAAGIFEAVRDKSVSILINNAGFGLYGPFARNDPRTQTELMQVNMAALVELTHHFVQPMLVRRQGRILNVASLAAFQPGPTVNLYYASKAFVYSFSYALAAELDGSGVTVTTLCPGTTQTDFFARAGMRVARGWLMMDARTVAKLGYRGLMRGRRVVIPGFFNKLAAALSKRAPARLTSAVVRRVHPPLAGGGDGR
jgi:short-subunit dehydrogenase